jgi:nucleoside-diphosphate-sugar epimerase
MNDASRTDPEKAANKNALVTGATGFVGVHLIRKLLSEDYRIFAIARDEKKLVELLGKPPHDRLVILKGDLLNAADLENLSHDLQNRVGDLQVVIHLVGGGPLTSNRSLAQQVFDLNYTTTANLVQILEAANKLSSVPLFIYFSSLTAMGMPATQVDRMRYDETTACNPVLPHGKAKLATEEFLRELSIKNKLKAVNLRLPQIYCGDNDPLIPVINLIRKGVFPVVRNKVGSLPLIHLADIVNATYTIIREATRIPGNYAVYVICEKSYSYDHLTELVRKKYGRGGTLKIPYWLLYLATFTIEGVFQVLRKPEPLNRLRLVSMTTDRIIDCRKFIETFNFRFDHNLEDFIIHQLPPI